MKILSWKIRLILLSTFVAPSVMYEQVLAAEPDDPFLSTVRSLNLQEHSLPPSTSASTSALQAAQEKPFQCSRNQNAELTKRISLLERQLSEAQEANDNAAVKSEEIESYQAEVAELRNRIKQTEAALAAAQKRDDQSAPVALQLENRALQAQLDALQLKQINADDARKQLQIALQENKKLKTAISQQNQAEDLSSAQSEEAARLLQAARAENEDLNKKLAALQQQITDKQQSGDGQRAVAEKALQTAQAENKALSDKLAALQTQFSTTQAQLADTRSQLTAESTSEKEKDAQRLKLEKSLQTAQIENKTLSDKLAALQTQFSTTQAQLADTRSQLTAGNASEKEKDAQRIKLEKSLQTAQVENKTLSDKLAALQTQFSATQDQLADTRSRLTAGNASDKEKDALRLNLEKSLQTAQVKNEVLNGKLVSLQAKLSSTLAQLTDARNQLTAGSASEKEKDAQRLKLEKTLQTAQAENNALSDKLAALQTQFSATQAQLTAGSASEKEKDAQRLKLEKSLQTAQAENNALSDKLAALQTQFSATQAQLTAGSASEKEKDAQRLKLEKALQTAQAENKSFSDKMAAMQAELASTQTQLADTRSLLSNGNASAKEKDVQRSALEKSLATLQQNFTLVKAELDSVKKGSQAQQVAQDNAQKALEERQKQITALTAQITELTPRLAAAQQNEVTTTQQRSTLQKQLDESQKLNAELQAKMAALETGNAAAQKKITEEKEQLQKELAALKSDASQAGKQQRPVEVKSKQQRQSYAAGIILSEGIEKSLKLQKTLGIEVDKEALLAGVADSVTGKSQMDPQQLNENYDLLAGQMATKEKSLYDSGFRKLQAATSGKKMLEQNRSTFFVLVKKGSAGAVKEGEKITMKLTQRFLDGRTVAPPKTFPIVYSESLPYIMHKAIKFANKGGEVDIYCFASDMYPPDMLPANLLGFDLIKYTLTVVK